MKLTDTHCHIQSAGLNNGEKVTRELWAKKPGLSGETLAKEAVENGVTRLICVGCDLADSKLAVNFVQNKPNCWASIGIHPHEAKDHLKPKTQAAFAALAAKAKVIAIGETGLDYYYTHSPKNDQYKILEFQLDLAQKNDLPLIFHVREAFSDFWPIFDRFQGLRGVVHSFSSDSRDLEQILSRGLYVGLNGIMTFTKNQAQLEAAKAVPLDKLLLETDAPFLTPSPRRGTICKPKYVVHTAEFLAGLREENLAEIAEATTRNACNLFGLK